MSVDLGPAFRRVVHRMEGDPSEVRPIGRNSAKSPPSWRFRAEFRAAWICDRPCRIARKSGRISDARRSAVRPIRGPPPDRPKFSEITTYLAR